MAEVNITVDDEHLGSIESVAAGLRTRGLDVTQVSDLIGIISGTTQRDLDDVRADLLGVPGVASVEEAGTLQVPPPESGVQ